MKKDDTKRIALHMPLCAGILGIAGIFYWFGISSLLLPVAAIAVIILLLNLILRMIGKFLVRNPKKWIKRLSEAVLAGLMVLVTLCSLVYAEQDSMLFYNVKSPESREFLQGKPGYSEVEFTAENGKTYHGMLYRQANEAAPLVIYFGGNGECSYQRMRGLEENNRWRYYAGYNYLYMDYEGYGLNDGKTDYLNMYEEALAVFDYAVTLPNVDSNHIVVMGYSLGTGSAIYLAANRTVAGLILAAPYDNGINLYNNMLPIFYGPMELLVKQKLPSDAYATSVTCPVLLIASHSDGTVPYSESERLSKLFSGDVDFVTLESEGHNDLFAGAGVYERIQGFLEEVASS